uniref:IRS-type PTB domain-containing protein n=1 Tax=Gorilla gorilla gorilla TaxID=9595 RepID=A0A2I2YBS9_GORGO
MDGAMTEGPLFSQSQHFGTKRWRKTWAVLYPASPHGVAWLKFFDHKGSSSGSGRGSSCCLDCKVIHLAKCVSLVPVAVESLPEPSATAFHLDTHLLAVDVPPSAAWLQTLCQNPLRKGSWTLEPTNNPPELSALEMLENSLCSPTWEGSQFWVTVQRTEAVEHCGLHASYVLRVEAERLTLLTMGAQSQVPELLLSWPYTLLHRCGRNKVMFSFEASTAQGNDIFQADETAIHRQKAQGKARQGHNALRADSHERKVVEGKFSSPPALYAEPLDSLHIASGPSQGSLYSDLLDGTLARAGEGVQWKKPLSWDLYEHEQQQLLKAKLTDPKEDPIYDEPEGLAPALPQGLYDLCVGCQAQGYKLPYNPATDAYAMPPSQRTKTLPASKSQGPAFPEPSTATGRSSKSHNSALYSQVQKSGASGSWDCVLSTVGTDRTGVKSEVST